MFFFVEKNGKVFGVLLNDVLEIVIVLLEIVCEKSTNSVNFQKGNLKKKGEK